MYLLEGFYIVSKHTLAVYVVFIQTWLFSMLNKR